MVDRMKRLEFITLYFIFMQKAGVLAVENIVEPKNIKQAKGQIKFNVADHDLTCFKGQKQAQSHQDKAKHCSDRKKSWRESPTSMNIMFLSKTVGIKKKNPFNETVVFLDYGDLDVYIDNSARKKSLQNGVNRSKSPKQNKDEHSISDNDDFVSSCVRVITEQTDNTSKHLSQSQRTPLELTPRSSTQQQYPYYNHYYNMQYLQPKQRSSRKKRSVTIQEARNFIINYDNIQSDGRTTIMVKNIPNKYTQNMLHQEFSINHAGAFDFFYLPIDKNNDCNIGYAFVNFINTSCIKAFYNQFHNRKWQKYKSPKICQLYYARYQGTLELVNHFRHTKIVQQKDKKIKPMFGQFNKELREIIQHQRTKEQTNQ